MSNSIIVGRTRARSQAIQVVFQAAVQGVDVFDLLEGGEVALDDGPLDDYAAKIARGVAVNRINIDRIVGGVSHNWNLSRMPLVDRCIMGVAVYEMFCEDDVPVSVAISEAVELSKVYGTDDSSSFVNGILGRVATLGEENPGAPLAHLAHLVAATDPKVVSAAGDDAADGEGPAGESPADGASPEEGGFDLPDEGDGGGAPLAPADGGVADERA